jgi:acyl carrier protein
MIWCEVLGITAASLQDNFMRLGGDSLQVLDVVARVNSECNVDLSVQDFLAAPTIELLAKRVELTSTGRDVSKKS